MRPDVRCYIGRVGAYELSLVYHLRGGANIEFARLHDRHVFRFVALANATSIDADLTKRFRQALTVAHWPTDIGKLTPTIYRGDRVARCQMGQLDTSAGEKQRHYGENYPSHNRKRFSGP